MFLMSRLWHISRTTPDFTCKFSVPAVKLSVRTTHVWSTDQAYAVRRKGIFRFPNQSMMKYGVVTIVQRPAIVQNTNWQVTTCPREVEHEQILECLRRVDMDQEHIR